MSLLSCPRCQGKKVRIVITEDTFEKPKSFTSLCRLQDGCLMSLTIYTQLDKRKTKSYLRCESCNNIWNTI